MTSTNLVVLSPDRETPTFYQQMGKFHYRAAYSRSTDSRNNNEPGQDYLTFRIEDDRFAFALCDGVSQSFYGDLAARILGDKLLEWIWKLDLEQPQNQIQENLHQELNTLTDEASLLVRDHPIPENVSPMVRTVLEKKRALGSETTFAAGFIDIPKQIAGFAWMGDSRLRLWRGNQELTAPFADQFKTSERWSTVKGPVGEAHLVSIPFPDFDHLAVYSDGFSYLDDAYKAAGATRPFSDHAINQFISDAASRPSSDDISFLEIWISPLPPKFPKTGEALAAPAPEYTHRNGTHFLSWKPVLGATEYEIKFSSENKTTLSCQKTDACQWQNEDGLDANARFIAVRAWQDGEPSPWSSLLSLEQPAPTPVPRPQTDPLPPLFSREAGASNTQYPPVAPPTPPSTFQNSSLHPAPETAIPAFAAPPGEPEPPAPIRSQPVPPIASAQTRQQPVKRYSFWQWGSAIIGLFCLSGIMILMFSGAPENLTAMLGLASHETPTFTPTKTKKPTPMRTLAEPTPGSETPPLEQSFTATITGTPTPTETMTGALTPSGTLTMTLTPTLSATEQAAPIKEEVKLLPVPNLQYAPVDGSPTYQAGVVVTILRIYSDSGVDWYNVRAADGLEGWVMAKKLDLESVVLEIIPLAGQIIFPSLTPTVNP